MMQGRAFGRLLRSICALAARALLKGLEFLVGLALGLLESEPSPSRCASSPSPTSTTMRKRTSFQCGEPDGSSTTSDELSKLEVPPQPPRTKLAGPLPASRTSAASSWEMPPQPHTPEFFVLATVDSKSMPATEGSFQVLEPQGISQDAKAEIFERFLRDHKALQHPQPALAAELSMLSLEPSPPDQLASSQEGLNRWQRLVLVARLRRQWSTRGALLRVRKHGPPQKERPAKGFGKHLRKWGHNEVRHYW